MIATDVDFINIKRFDYSLAKLCDKYPEGCEDHIIASALGMPETDVDKRYNELIALIRKQLVDNVDD